MSYQWFRFYAEFGDDPKVQSMPFAMQRHLAMLFCARCRNMLETLPETDLIFWLRVTSEEFAEMKALFIAKGFIDQSLNILNWNKRQFVSDSSTARVAKHRAKLKSERAGNETLQQCRANGPDTDTDADSNQKQTIGSTPPRPPGASAPRDERPVVNVERGAKDGDGAQLTHQRPTSDAVASIPLRDGTEFEVPMDQYAKWVQAYPGVDVRQEFRKMRAWSDANEQRRKTRRGVKRFIVGWLAKEQAFAPTAGRSRFRPAQDFSAKNYDGGHLAA